MAANWKDFGLKLKELRQGYHISREKFGTMMNKQPATIASWEQGHRRPKIESIREISNFFGEPIQTLQSLAGYTPEFDWKLSFIERPSKDKDILSEVTEEEREELRKHLLYLRFVAQLKSSQTI